MSIGRGWYEDAISEDEANELGEYRELNNLFSMLLKDKIEEVFSIARKLKDEKAKLERST